MSNKVWDDGVKEAVKDYQKMFHLDAKVAETVLDSGVEVKDFILHLLEEAGARSMDAGFSGRHDDGGARNMARSIAAWVAGLHDEIPKEFEKSYTKYFEKMDPEYQEYLRLQKKFE